MSENNVYTENEKSSHASSAFMSSLNDSSRGLSQEKDIEVFSFYDAGGNSYRDLSQKEIESKYLIEDGEELY